MSMAGCVACFPPLTHWRWARACMWVSFRSNSTVCFTSKFPANATKTFPHTRQQRQRRRCSFFTTHSPIHKWIILLWRTPSTLYEQVFDHNVKSLCDFASTTTCLIYKIFAHKIMSKTIVATVNRKINMTAKQSKTSARIAASYYSKTNNNNGINNSHRLHSVAECVCVAMHTI